MHRRMLLAGIGSGSLTHNLELEGSLSAITTNAQLATFLGVEVSKIRTFTSTGTVIHVNIRGNYNIPNSQFYNNTSLAKLRDIGGIIYKVGQNGLRNTQLTDIYLPKVTMTNASSIAYNTNLEKIELPDCSIAGNQFLRGNSAAKQIIINNIEVIQDSGSEFSGSSSLELLDAKKLKYYGNPATGYGVTASGFNLLKIGCIINVNVALKTANAGAVNEALRYAKVARGAIVNFYNDDGSYHSTL